MTLDDVTGIHLVETVDDAMECKRWLSTTNRVALDTETTGLSPEKDHVRLLQLGDCREAWCIPVERNYWGGFAIELLKKYDGYYDMHNLPYDYAMCRSTFKVDLPRHRCNDTRLMVHILDSHGSTALKNAAARYVDPRAKRSQEDLQELMKRSGWTWATIPIEVKQYWLYAGLDTIWTSQLRRKIWPLVAADAPDAYELELAVLWPIINMMRRGVYVDLPYLAGKISQLSSYTEEARDWCNLHYGINPGSNVQVADALVQAGMELNEVTKGGHRSVAKGVLEELDHPLATTVLGYRQATKLVSTYLQNYINLSDEDGLMHFRINTIGGKDKTLYESGGSTGVRTGRMSMDEPNLQNVPTRTKAGKQIRNGFIPREGCKWVKCDADQIEMRLLAHFTQEKGMIAAFKSEEDFFVSMCQQMYHDQTITKDDPRRQLVKNAGYAKIYMAGVEKFAQTAQIPLETARQFLQQFDEMYPAVRAKQNEIGILAKRRQLSEGEAYIRSPFTKRKHVADKNREYALMNYMIQGAAAEVLKLKIVEADNAGLGEYMLFPVHDELDFDVPVDLVGDVVQTIRTTMNDDKLLSVPMSWTVSVGDRWGDLVDV